MQDRFDQQLQYTDQTMVGLYVAVFFKRRVIDLIMPSSLAPCRVKVGVKGTTGNKGAVCIRFQIKEESFIIMNCHLASGRHKDTERIG